MRIGSFGRHSRTLPKNLLSSQFTLLEDFETIGDWTTSGNVSCEENSTQFFTGTKSVKITTTVAGSNGNIRKNVSTSIPNPHFVRLHYYEHDANLSQISIYFMNSAGNGYNATVPLTVYPAANIGAWKTYDIPFNTPWGTSGSPSWGSLITQILVRVFAKTGQNTSISVDALEIFGAAVPSIRISFDDAWQSIYNYAFPYMKARGMVGTFYVISSLVDTGSYITTAQLREMYAAGWDIGNHTRDHTDLVSGGLSDAQIQAEFTDAKAFLDGIGLTRASAHVSFPYGSVNASVIANAQTAGMLSGRCGVGGKAFMPIIDWYQLAYYGSYHNVSLATLTTDVDNSLTGEYPYGVIIHDIAITPASGQLGLAIFQGWIDYLISKNIQTLTTSETYALQNGPILVRHK